MTPEPREELRDEIAQWLYNTGLAIPGDVDRWSRRMLHEGPVGNLLARVDRAEAENERLRETLTKIADAIVLSDRDNYALARGMRERARAALAPSERT